MEPNKLENNFREQLSKREIQPSEMAWDRLDAMLTISENKKPKKKTWMYVAASFVGFLLIGSLFYNASDKQVETNESVVIQEKELQKPEMLNPEKETTLVLKSVLPNSNAMASAGVSSKKPIHKVVQNDAIVSNQEEQQIQDDFVVHAPDVKTNKYIESENLLAEVETNLQSESIKTYVAKSGVKVSSKNLLRAVEGELDNTFREKVVRSISKNFESVKSSLATRNQE